MKEKHCGKLNGIVINASTQWSFTRVAYIDNKSLSRCVADGIVKKGLLCKHQKQTHKHCWPSESPIHLFFTQSFVVTIPDQGGSTVVMFSCSNAHYFTMHTNKCICLLSHSFCLFPSSRNLFAQFITPVFGLLTIHWLEAAISIWFQANWLTFWNG